MCAFCAPLKKQESRYKNQTNIVPKKNEPARNTNTHPKIIKQSAKMSPRRGFWGVRGRLGGLLAPRSAPKGSKNHLERPPGAQKKSPQNRQPPPAWIPRRSAPLGFGAFSFENLAGACTGCKIEGSRVLGCHSREKLKLLSTTSKLVV